MDTSKYCFIAFVALFSIPTSLSAQLQRPDIPDSLDSLSQGAAITDLIDDIIPGTKRHLRFGVETNFVSDTSRVVGLYVPSIGEQNPTNVFRAADSFLTLLDNDQSDKILHELDSPERRQWTNLPAQPNAGGLRLGDMEQIQLKNFLELLANVLSPTGYEKLRMIMLADDQLLNRGRKRPGFGIENFSVVIFGKPSKTKLWAIQLDGHHLGLNIVIAGERISIAPSFIGTQPSKFTLGEHEIKPMQTEVEAAFLLANELTNEQFKSALLSNRRGKIKTGPGRDGKSLKPQGVACSTFNEAQKKHLFTLVAAWVSSLPKQQARRRLKEIESEIDRMYFSWNGPRKTGSDVSYTIQSPSMIIEFAYQDLGGDPLNHIHSQYRNPKNDYGVLFEQ